MLANIDLLIQVPLLNLQLLLDGLLIGAIFVLSAYGLALVWGVMNVKNLAQGDFVIMGGYVAYFLSIDTVISVGIPAFNFESLGWSFAGLTFFAFTKPGMHPLLSMIFVIPVMFGFGWLIYRLIIARVVDKDLFTSLLATFGLSLLMQQIINNIYGPDVLTAHSGFEIRSFFDGFVTVADIKVISFVLAGVLALGVVVFMKKSRMGQAIRATAQDARAARVMGINTDRVYAFTYALNAAICGAAGVLVSMIWVIQPFYGIGHSIRAFVIVTAAGLGNLPGVIMTGLGLGVLEQFSAFIVGAELQVFTVVFALLLVLIWRQIQQARIRQVVR